MKITTLIENCEDDRKVLINEHGLSMFIETSYGNILFDTGQSGDFIENAENMNIDLKSIDALVLSHAHYDHCGGVKRLIETYNISPHVIVGNKFFNNSCKYHYNEEENTYRYNGIDFDEEYLKSQGINITYVSENKYKLNDEVYVFTNFKRFNDFEKDNKYLKIKVNDNEYTTDKFIEEISIGLKTEKGLIVLLGCAHPGFLNIIESIKEYSGETVAGVIGGTHLVSADDYRIEKSAEYLNNENINMLGLSHCTGIKAAQILNKCCRGTFINKTGAVLKIN